MSPGVLEDTVELRSQNYPSLLRELFRGFSEDQRTGMKGVGNGLCLKLKRRTSIYSRGEVLNTSPNRAVTRVTRGGDTLGRNSSGPR